MQEQNCDALKQTKSVRCNGGKSSSQAESRGFESRLPLNAYKWLKNK